MRKLLWQFGTVIAVVVIDQASKAWALNYLRDLPHVEVLGQFFMLTLVLNEGGAMGTNFGSSTYYLVSSILILLFVLYYIYVNRENRIISISLSCIAGGAIGNIVDRIIYGKVIDFLDFDFFDINIFGYYLERWWTFNFADAVISCSIIFLLINILFLKHYDVKTNGQGKVNPFI